MTDPCRADEKTTLLAALQSHRDVMLWKLDGLSDEQIRRPLVPSGTTLLGLVKHLANVEYGWFCETFGRPTEPLTDISRDPGADMRAADAGHADILRELIDGGTGHHVPR